MPVKVLTAVCLLVFSLGAAQLPLPDLRIEPTGGGSIFQIRNAAPQPLIAFVVELVDYPGSYYSLWRDAPADPIPAGGERRIQVSNMIVGAVPDYVKLRAALFADGSAAGDPEAVAKLIERRRFLLKTAHEIVRRLESGITVAELRERAGSPQLRGKPDPRSQEFVNWAAAHDLIALTGHKLESDSKQDTLLWLHGVERNLTSGLR